MIIAFFIEALLALYYANRYREKKNIFVDIAFVLIYIVSKHFLEDYYYVNLITMTMEIIVLLYVSGNRKWLQLFYLGLLFALLIQTSREMVYGLIPDREVYLSHEHELRIAAIIVKTLLIFIWVRILSKSDLEYLHIADFISIVIPVLVLEYSRYFTLAIRAGQLIHQYDVLAFFLIQLCLLLSLSTSALRIRIAQSVQEKNKLDNLISSQYMLTRQKEQDDENIRRMYHDIKNIVNSIDDVGTARIIREEINQTLKGYALHTFCSNSLINAIISSKAEIASKEGIRFECFVNIEDYAPIGNSDIVSVFGNLLDNAIEALRKVPEEEKIIRLKVIDNGQYLIIKSENYYDGKLAKEGEHYLTTKDNKKEHGIGLRSIEYVAQKYNGKVTVNSDNNLFSVCVIMQKS
ncbi:MAG: sensor histidine kinase [Erysipelotrichaceae bacterium]